MSDPSANRLCRVVLKTLNSTKMANRKAMIMWTITSTLLSLVVILLTYFGWVRYATLHLKSVEHFSKNYMKLAKADKDAKVVISFTADPKKILNLKPMLNSILDQTVRVDQIGMTIPDSKTYDIPSEYKDVINIFKCGKDYGVCNKIIPALLRERESDTMIIYLKDNEVYGKDVIESLVEESRKHPQEAITTHCGKATLVKPSFFGADVSDLGKDFFDDNWIQVKLNVPRRKIICEIYRAGRLGL
jgi:hypothetical protein